ncbi:uncharacterized protein LOC110444753, partial [Mizuhopecten yessoensis]|uniref:uncharacterized protein LOC110444753 n=1 Tax=Mizuhopecten yessoensis TaxID=6573 RepID=UPI000B45DFF6
IRFRQKTIIARACNPRYACHLHEAVRSGCYTCRLLQDKCYQGSDFKKQITQYWEKEDPTLINDLRDDVRVECGKFGEVKNVKIFDNHPDGVMMVYFKAADSADGCIAALHQRWFSKRRVIAQQWDGRTKYELEESEAERNERLSKWEKFLESDNTKSQGESECVVTKSQSDDAVDKSAKTDSKSEPNDVEVQPNNNKGQDDIGSIDKSNGKGSSNSQDVSLDTMPSEEETGDSAMITE